MPRAVRRHRLLADPDAAVTLMVSWTEPVLDEPLEAIVDGIARTLRL
ncbi:hypothetical protein [Streptomyces sp. MA15]|nr:hypothetical protein [Streptomyces sp. MA15]MDN3268510.1 hypothetical protein [Streptomyces sp. MA15]